MPVVLAILLALPVAFAGKTPPSGAELTAEAIRLTEEIRKASRAGTWKAVERRYIEAMKTGVPLDTQVHLSAAEAARQRGDLSATRARLFAAVSQEPTNEVATRELASLDARFARVHLMAPLDARLEAYDRAFDPLMIRVVEQATATLAETGAYIGLLPPGSYTIDGDPFEAPLGSVTVFDLSLPPPPPSDEPRQFWQPR